MSWMTAWLVCGLLGAALDLRSIRDLVNDDLTSWIGAAVAVTVAIVLGPLQLATVIALRCSKRLRRMIGRQR